MFLLLFQHGWGGWDGVDGMGWDGWDVQRIKNRNCWHFQDLPLRYEKGFVGGSDSHHVPATRTAERT